MSRWVAFAVAAVVLVALFLVVPLLVAGFLLGRGEGALDEERPFVIRVVARIDPPDAQFDAPALVLADADAESLGVRPRIEATSSPSQAVWRLETRLVETEDLQVDYCFRGDVRVEGSGETAVSARTCVNDDALEIELAPA